MFGRNHHRCHEKIKDLTSQYEKKIFDLNQLIEISKSLNSNLDYNNLVQSILYICMGQLKVLKAGLFARKDIDRQHLYLHRSLVGFDINHEIEYIIPEGHALLSYFQDNFRSHSFSELVKACPSVMQLAAISSLDPYMVVPLRSKSVINGVLVLGEPIEGMDITREDREYVLNIAHLAGIAVHNAFLYEITTTDMMTKLKLRHFLIDVLQDHMAHARQDRYQLALIMIDIDHFKELNDKYGHICGDIVIGQIAQIFLANIRQTDVAARYGGEEFVLLLPESDANTAAAIAERIRVGVENQVFKDGVNNINVTISMGIAQYDSEIDATVPGFISRADAAMYESKHAGRNRITIAP